MAREKNRPVILTVLFRAGDSRSRSNDDEGDVEGEGERVRSRQYTVKNIPWLQTAPGAVQKLTESAGRVARDASLFHNAGERRGEA